LICARLGFFCCCALTITGRRDHCRHQQVEPVPGAPRVGPDVRPAVGRPPTHAGARAVETGGGAQLWAGRDRRLPQDQQLKNGAAVVLVGKEVKWIPESAMYWCLISLLYYFFHECIFILLCFRCQTYFNEQLNLSLHLISIFICVVWLHMLLLQTKTQVVRSHEVRDGGYEWEHGPDKLATVFSAPNYCDQMGNKGAYIHFKRQDGYTPHFNQFNSVPHPPVRPMQYANMLANM